MDQFESSLPMVLNRTLDAIMPWFRAVFKQHNITEQQWRILRVLWQSKRCSTVELSTKTLLPGPSLAGILDRMVDKELIQRERGEQDRRKIFISATDKGQQLEKKISPEIDSIYKNIINKCNPQDWQIMMKTLQSITEETGIKRNLL